MKVLIEYNADVNKVNSFSETPIHMAATNSHISAAVEIVKLLLAAGADTCKRNHAGKLASEIA